MNKIMSKKANIFDFGLITSSAEGGIYFLEFFFVLGITLETPGFLKEIFKDGNELTAAIFIIALVMILSILLFLGYEIYGIVKRNKCLIVAGLIFRGVKIVSIIICIIINV